MPVSKNEALLKTLDTVTNPKEKVSVIHAAFDEKPHLVAFVEVDKEWTDMEKLEYAFMKTNTINEAWMLVSMLNMLALSLGVVLPVLVIKFWLVQPRMFVSLPDGVKCNDESIVNRFCP